MFVKLNKWSRDTPIRTTTEDIGQDLKEGSQCGPCY